jgi:hypothetical protein
MAAPRGAKADERVAAGLRELTEAMRASYPAMCRFFGDSAPNYHHTVVDDDPAVQFAYLACAVNRDRAFENFVAVVSRIEEKDGRVRLECWAGSWRGLSNTQADLNHFFREYAAGRSARVAAAQPKWTSRYQTNCSFFLNSMDAGRVDAAFVAMRAGLEANRALSGIQPRPAKDDGKAAPAAMAR